MTYQVEFNADNFPWWSGACQTVEEIRNAGKMDELQAHIEEIFSCSEEPPTDTDINDYVWFDLDLKDLGIEDEDEEEDEENEDEDEEEE